MHLWNALLSWIDTDEHTAYTRSEFSLKIDSTLLAS